MRSILAAALLLAATSAMATHPAPAPTAPQATAGAQSTAGAKASAAATSTAASTSDAMGGGASNAGDSTRMYVLPGPVWTPPLPLLPATTCVQVDQDSMGVVFGAYSQAGAHASPDKCIALSLYNAAVTACRYATAKQISDRLTARVLPGFEAGAQQLTDYSPADCRMLSSPLPVRPVFYETACTQPPAVARTTRKTARAPKVDACGRPVTS